MSAPAILIKTAASEHVLLIDRVSRIEIITGCYDGVEFQVAACEQLWITDFPELSCLSDGRNWNLNEVACLVADPDWGPVTLQAWEWIEP